MITVDVTFLYIVVVFLLCAWVLNRFLFAPLLTILDGRRDRASAAAKSHAESLEALARTVAQAEEKLAVARREALKVREGLRGEGAAALTKRLDEARAASETALREAATKIEADAKVSAEKLPGQTLALARELAEKILGRKLAA
jgi:F-type H+-transporting ATPase subunit b